ncbi:MAG: signal peptidase II [Verrucomicrobiia bacterium]
MNWVLLIAAIIAVMDQLTKWLVMCRLEMGESHLIIPGFFNLVHWINTGAAWGILKDRNLALTLIAVITILLLYLFRHPFQFNRLLGRVALGLIMGGIVGNLIDRVRLGHVVDFLDFHIGRHHWPAFNVADTAICVGVALYILDSWRAERETAGAEKIKTQTQG